MSYINHYNCVHCNKTYNLIEDQLVCPDCGHLLFAEYDLYRARQELYRRFSANTLSIWRYADLLPVNSKQRPVSLDEGVPRLVQLRKMSARNSAHLFLLDEGRNPSGSVRDREMSVLFSALQRNGSNGLLISGSPNSCISAAAYAAQSGVACHVVIPNSVPLQFLGELNSYGATVHLCKTIGDHCRKMEESLIKENRLMKINAGSTPFRVEGAKTILFNLWEYFKYELPDYIFIPVGEGITVLGIWKGLNELKQLGWLQSSVPRVIAVESAHRASLSKAFGNAVYSEDEMKDTVAVEMNNTTPLEVDLLKTIFEEENWQIIALADDLILKIRKQIAREEGILISPEGSATIGAYRSLKNQIGKHKNHTAVFINPVSGIKYVQSVGFLKTEQID